jgi:gamma-glutamyltranspeptidase
MSKDVRSNLIAKGQNIGREITIGRVQGILIDSDKNVIFGGSDSRGNGSAEGF